MRENASSLNVVHAVQKIIELEEESSAFYTWQIQAGRGFFSHGKFRIRKKARRQRMYQKFVNC